MTYPESNDIKQLVDAAQSIVILQADNPDADSLGSALALEQILGDLGKEPYMYCGVDVPDYLRYFAGWDRVSKDLPRQFDLSIIVDASTYTLFEQLDKTSQFGAVKSKPCVVIDHHGSVERPLEFAAVNLIDGKAASAGEMVFTVANQLGWPVSKEAAEPIMSSILGDTQGLTNNQTSANTYRVMADLTDLGANRPLLEELRREYSRMPESIYRYKAELLARTEFLADSRIATVSIPQNEINLHSPLYNPAVLVQFDSLQVTGVKLSVIFKTYDDGKVTGKIRTNISAPIAAQLAEHFGGGGHAHSAGFKVSGGRPFNEIKSECISYATKLLDTLNTEDTPDNETIQHTYSKD